MEAAAPPGSLGLELQFLLADRGAGEAGAGNLTCAALQTGSDWVVLLDLTWGGWPGLQAAANAAAIPLLRLDSVNHLVGQIYLMIPCMSFIGRQLTRAALDVVEWRGAGDAALLTGTEHELEESLQWVIGNSALRLVLCCAVL